MNAGDDLGASGERLGAVEQAQRHIAAMIDLRRAVPGERLPNAAALAAEIGVSRPAVLQALKLLADRGRVIVRPGRGGTWVAPHDPDNLDERVARAWRNREKIRELALLREMLEPGVARLVADRGMAPELLAEARSLCEEMTGITDLDEYRALDTRFHLVIASATGMKRIEDFTKAFRSGISVAFDVRSVPPARMATSNKEHERLLDAIEKGKGDRAADIALAHVATTTRAVEEILAKLDTAPPGNLPAVFVDA